MALTKIFPEPHAVQSIDLLSREPSASED